MRNQYDILLSIQAAGYNVVTCGNCGDVVLLDIYEPIMDDIQCPHCKVTMDYSDFPDLYYGKYNPTKFKEM